MKFLPFGDSAILINFEQLIDYEINQKVIDLTQNIEAANWQELTFLTPAYCSLTIGFNSNISSYASLINKIKSLPIINSKNKTSKGVQANKTIRSLKIPVCYDAEFALDMEDLITKKKLSKEEIIKLHTTTHYNVYMLGFLPGFPYLGTLTDELICDRKDIPRIKVPAGSVGIAANQTGIYPLEAPGGWQIIGRTPIGIFNVKQGNSFLFQVGDSVQFDSISLAEYYEIENKLILDKFNLMSLYV